MVTKCMESNADQRDEREEGTEEAVTHLDAVTLLEAFGNKVEASGERQGSLAQFKALAAEFAGIAERINDLPDDDEICELVYTVEDCFAEWLEEGARQAAGKRSPPGGTSRGEDIWAQAGSRAQVLRAQCERA